MWRSLKAGPLYRPQAELALEASSLWHSPKSHRAEADCADWHRMRNNCDINRDSGFKSDYTAENRGVMGARIGVTSCSKCKYHSIGTQVTQPALGGYKPPDQPYITKLAFGKPRQLSRARPTFPQPDLPTHSAPPHSQTYPPTQSLPTVGPTHPLSPSPQPRFCFLVMWILVARLNI